MLSSIRLEGLAIMDGQTVPDVVVVEEDTGAEEEEEEDTTSLHRHRSLANRGMRIASDISEANCSS